MLKIGMSFPEFKLLDQDGATVTRDALLDGRTIVYFYPKDDTPGCTAEACAFNDRLPNFAGARVFGVSPDGPASHKAFAEKYGLRFPLLSDTDRELSLACGLWGDDDRLRRTTFLLDAQGVILHVWYDVNPQGHADEILAWL